MNNKIKISQVVISLLAMLIIAGLGIILFRTYNSNKALNPEILRNSTPFKKEAAPLLFKVELPEKKELKPSRPEDLGITVYYEDNRPKTQEEWNTLVRESYQKNRREFEQTYSDEFGPNLYKQLDEADLEEIETNRVRIEGRIAEYEEELNANPGDKYSEEKLENWRKFKALLITIYGEKSNIEK
ncbi:MAG: hypothetical protein KJ648_02770 [Candidatus Omnitrophica bacterium]|nr:hypothetical protein [Candidatus Omnitrophota bacterium]